MKTIDEVRAAIESAGIALSMRGSEKVMACGCEVVVDSFGKVKITPDAADADPDRIRRALR